MTTTLETALKIASWDEAPEQELAEGGKVSRARVELAEGADGLRSGTMHSLL